MKKVSRLSLKLKKKSEIGRKEGDLQGRSRTFNRGGGGKGGTTSTEGTSFVGGVWGHAPAGIFENLSL